MVRVRGAVAVALVAAGCLTLLTTAVLVVDPLFGELPALRAVHVSDGPVRAAAAAVSAATGSEVVAATAAACGLTLLLLRRRGDAVVVGASVAAVLVIVPLLKPVVGRPRPDLWPQTGEASAYSYPSGHAAATAALGLAVLVVLAHRPRSRTAVAAAVTSGLLTSAVAQLVLGRHQPSDLLAGWLLALVCVSVVVAARHAADGRRLP